MEFYEEMRDLATELLDEFGMPMVVERLTNGTFAKVGAGRGAFVDDTQENERQSRSSLLANTAVRTRKVVLSAAFKGVQPNDRLTADKQTYTVQTVAQHRPTTTTIAYEVEVI